LASAPTIRAIAHWQLSSFAVDRWAPSADGTVVAAELEGRECPSDVFVMRTDGSGLRRPFEADDRSATVPMWAPDGSRLIAFGVPWPPPPGPHFARPPSTLLAWDPATNTTVDLGRPCSACQPGGGVAWSPDSSRIAVDYTDPSCGCGGIAVATPGGRWSVVSSRSGDLTSIALLAWPDEGTLLVAVESGLALLDLQSHSVVPLPTSAPNTIGRPDQAISPDHTMAITGGIGTSTLEVTKVRSGKTRRFGPIPPDWLDVAWSPDSKWIIVQADADGYGADRGFYLIRVDGSEPVRRIIEGGFGVMAWMPASG